MSVPAISVTVTISTAFAQILMAHFFACACEDTQATAKVVLVLVPVRILAPNFRFLPLLYMVEKIIIFASCGAHRSPDIIYFI